MTNILVTGATGGIGRQAAIMLAEMGYRVFGAGRDLAKLQTLEEEHQDLSAIRIDISDEHSVRDAMSSILEQTDGHGVDILINNAGFAQVGPIELVTEEEWLGQYQTNVFGLVRMSRAVLPKMRERKVGRIVNVSSVVGRVALPYFGPYNSTKHAVEAISDALRQELRNFGIKVTIVEPGAVKTGFAAVEQIGFDRHGDENSPYHEDIRLMRAFHDDLHAAGANVDTVARTVVKAALARRPRTRYVTPWLKNRINLVLAEWLPTSITDGVIRNMTKLDRAKRY
nr:SDR family oxidoreductase [Hyphomonas sp. Mor2]